MCHSVQLYIFFFNDTATTEIYTLSLHDALPILELLEKAAGKKAVVDHWRSEQNTIFGGRVDASAPDTHANDVKVFGMLAGDRKSTRLNSSHSQISYAVFCLKKKKKKYIHIYINS